MKEKNWGFFFNICRIKCFDFSFLDDFFSEFGFFCVYTTMVELIPYKYWQERSKNSLGACALETPGSCVPRYPNEREL